jgi:hypothetical protein
MNAIFPTLSSQIKTNCNISDAKYWGEYSVCGLLLKLRELFRTESGIRPWEQIPHGEIGKWISEREALWRELNQRDFNAITLNENAYDPFDAVSINAVLKNEGLLYGAGYGLYMKPSFFLGRILSREVIDGYDVCITEHEYVQDLSDYPALMQDSTIFVRMDAARRLLWGKFDELRSKKTPCTLSFAFARYGITREEKPSEEADFKLSSIAYSEVEAYIRHEIGEAYEGKKLGEEWKLLLAETSDRKSELLIRGVKDLLSDTSEKGMLRHIIQNQRAGSLGFYIVFLGGYRKLLFPEISTAFRQFLETGEWALIEDARRAGYAKAGDYAEQMLSAHRNGSFEICVSDCMQKLMRQ